MPMTGRDAVLETAALQRETHVRATIIEGKDVPTVVDNEDRTVPSVHDDPPLCLQLLEASREHKFTIERIHGVPPKLAPAT